MDFAYREIQYEDVEVSYGILIQSTKGEANEIIIESKANAKCVEI